MKTRNLFLLGFFALFLISCGGGDQSVPESFPVLNKIKKDGKWGYTDVNNEIVIPCEYDVAREFKDGYAFVTKDKLLGVINHKGKVVVPLEKYEAYMNIYANGYFGLKKDEKWGVVNNKGKVKVPFEYDDCYTEGNYLGYFLHKDGNKGFFSFEKGKILLPCEYSDINFISDKEYIKVKKDKKYGLLDSDLKTILQIEYDDIDTYFKDGLIKVQKNHQYGYANNKGELVIPCSYDKADNFDDGYATVSVQGRDGLINTKGELVIPCQFNKINIYKDYNLAIVSIYDHGRRFGLYTLDGKNVLNCNFDGIMEQFDQGIIWMENDRKWGLFDTSGTEIQPCKYNEINKFDAEDGLAIVSETYHNYFLINKEGKNILSSTYNKIRRALPGIFILEAEPYPYLYGIANSKGEIIAPIEYEKCYVSDNSHGPKLFVVKKNGKYGLLNKDGQILTPCEYDKIDTRYNSANLYEVMKDGKYGYLDQNGKVAIPCEYDLLYIDYSKELFKAKKGNLWGAVNFKGETVIEFKYKNYNDFDL